MEWYMFQKRFSSQLSRIALGCALACVGAPIIAFPVQAEAAPFDELLSESVSGVGKASLTNGNDWGTGFQGSGVVLNDTATEIGNWTITFEADFNIDKIWNAEIVSHEGKTYVLRGMGYNRSIAPNAQATFGFTASPDSAQMPSSVLVRDTTRHPPTQVPSQVSMRNVRDRGSAFKGEVSILNKGSSEIIGWIKSFEADFEINQIWNSQVVAHVGKRYVVQSMGWKQGIAPSAQSGFGFNASPGGSVLPSSSGCRSKMLIRHWRTTNRLLKKSLVDARQGGNGRKSAVYRAAHEHFEPISNAASRSQRVFQQPAKRCAPSAGEYLVALGYEGKLVS
jgi:hypothetical protein